MDGEVLENPGFSGFPVLDILCVSTWVPMNAIYRRFKGVVLDTIYS